jgi:hypothetical protein
VGVGLGPGQAAERAGKVIEHKIDRPIEVAQGTIDSDSRIRNSNMLADNTPGRAKSPALPPGDRKYIFVNERSSYCTSDEGRLFKM